MKNIILVTGGAGFIGSALIEKLVKFKKYKIISLDNYSSGTITNHIKNNNVKYLRSNTINIANILNNKKKNIHTIFHFGEFSRIYQSFKKFNECINSNINGSLEVFKFSLKNNIRIIYSATSASLGNNSKDMNLSPYAFTKAKNLELLENLKKWFNFRCEVIYFYNVYGPRQICSGDMGTVVGIFENHFKKKKLLPVVRPGSQIRRFTHVDDTIDACLLAWKKKKNTHYSVASSQNYSIVKLARLFGSKIKYLPSRPGERFKSSVPKTNLGTKIINIKGRIRLKDYIEDFKNKNY